MKIFLQRVIVAESFMHGDISWFVDDQHVCVAVKDEIFEIHKKTGYKMGFIAGAGDKRKDYVFIYLYGAVVAAHQIRIGNWCGNGRHVIEGKLFG